jgi:F-type H+-transporting ATPase subunit alpha
VELAQYRELESFAAFGSDLDPTSQAQLDRGARLMELLKQGSGEPYPVEEEVVGIFLGTRGHLDSVPVEDVSRFETEFLEHVRRDGGVLQEVRESGKLSDEAEERLNKTVSEFKEQFSTTQGEGVADDGGSGELATGDDGSEESSGSSDGSEQASDQSSQESSDQSSDDPDSSDSSDSSDGSRSGSGS